MKKFVKRLNSLGGALAAICLAAAMTACSSDAVVGEPEVASLSPVATQVGGLLPESRPMEISAAVQGMGGEADTRVTYNEAAATFDDGDVIQVVNTSPQALPDLSVQGKADYTYNSSTGKFTGSLNWQYTQETLYAFRVGDGSSTTFPDASAFAVQTDQKSETNLKKSDFLFSPSVTVNYSAGTTATLSNFVHKVARVIVNIGGVSEGTVSQCTLMGNGNLVIDFKLDTDGNITLGSTKDNIEMYKKSNYVFEAFVPAQSFASATTNFLKFYYENGGNDRWYTYPLPNAVTFVEGQTTTITATPATVEADVKVLEAGITDSNIGWVAYKYNDVVTCYETVAAANQAGLNSTYYYGDVISDGNGGAKVMRKSKNIYSDTITADDLGTVVTSTGKTYPNVSTAQLVESMGTSTDNIVGMICYIGTGAIVSASSGEQTPTHGVIAAYNDIGPASYSTSESSAKSYSGGNFTTWGMMPGSGGTETGWDLVFQQCNGNTDKTPGGFWNLMTSAGMDVTNKSNWHWSSIPNGYGHYVFNGSSWNNGYGNVNSFYVRPCLAF